MASSFQQFMQRALYDPERGYYTARIRTVGARGDFSTTATLTPHLGQAIACWLREESAVTGVRTIIEIGGGDGSLMRAVQKSLGWWTRRRFTTLMVEASPILQGQQQDKLAHRVKAWYPTLHSALESCAGQALIFHNELMDAFPFALVEWNQDLGCWQEVFLHWENGSAVEKMSDLSFDPAPYSILSTRPATRQRAEVSTTYHDWLGSWRPLWKSGTMLSIDYGDTLPALYHRRPHGTLRGYLLQQRITGPDLYANIGRQDITADVNFTDIRSWLSKAPLTEQFYETQSAFLQRYSVPVSPDLADALAAFQVLSTRRGKT